MNIQEPPNASICYPTSLSLLLNDCVELLWRAQSDRLSISKNNKEKGLLFQTIKCLFNAIIEVDGVFGVLVSEAPGKRCIKRVLFDFNMIEQIEWKKLLKAEDVIAALVEKCYEHNEISPKLSQEFSVYKSCTDLLKVFENHQNARNVQYLEKKSLPPDLQQMIELNNEERESRYQFRKKAIDNPTAEFNDTILLSTQHKKNLLTLGMEPPQKSSAIRNFLLTLEQRKINSLKGLIDFFPCGNCHKQALIYFAPHKYSSFVAECEPSAPQHNFCLPFELVDKFGPWYILLSEDSVRVMRMLKKSYLEAIGKRLIQISSGKWKKHGLLCNVSSSNIPVYEVELSDYGDLKILWQVDYDFSIRNYLNNPLIIIWIITASKEQINKTLQNLAKIHQSYTIRHNRYCTIPENKADVILPRHFICEKETKSTYDNSSDLRLDDEELLENLFKSCYLGGADFTFQVSKVEQEIIRNPTSSIVVGRSGTGKTTCIVFRQIASYMANQLSKSTSFRGSSHKRQIFITVSYNLCRRVKEYFYKLRESASLVEKEMSEAEIEAYERKKGDGNIDLVDEDAMEEESGENESGDKDMMEEDDEEKELGNIPNSFRLLEDHHFPLFITYNKFSEMLQGTYGIDIRKLTTQQSFDDEADDDVYYSEEEKFHHNSSFLNRSDALRTHFVDYDCFEEDYWPRFRDGFRKKLDCELVYSEFSVIKGTNTEIDYLSREDYRAMSIKKYPTFCNNRDEIYDIFKKYEKMKALNGDYDSVDRTLAILRAAEKKALGGPYIHELYIDECQDNQILDFSLILKIFDGAESIMMAGDIAQCIARGSSFRFQDLRALMHKWELDHHMHNGIKTKLFELNVNYRSHNGIIQLASSVIDLIKQFFPDSIDHLSRERGEIDGPRPTVFVGFQVEPFLSGVFRTEDQETNSIEFGAEQVIIVRNDETKERVKSLHKNIGLILTVFEAKGMEFCDVLLYNFFTDSPARSKWRVILSDLEGYSKGTPIFSNEKHNIICSELKNLYVAVTRARHRLWILDDNSEQSEPILTYWKHHDLVSVIPNTEGLTNLALARKSNPEEWNERGKTFFERKQYELAIICFEKSKDEKRRRLANAYHLRQIARTSIRNFDDETVKLKFIRAAEAFRKCSRVEQEASCYQDADMHEEAGDVYAREGMLESAAHCYNKARKWRKAGDYFAKVNMYNEAINSYRGGKLYDVAIDFMKRQEIDEKIFHRTIRLIYIYSRKNNKDISEEALSILPTQEDQIEILRDHAPEEVQEVYKKNGQFHEAAKDLCSRGKFEEASNEFIRSNEKDDVIESLKCILHLCRENVLKNMTEDPEDSNTRKELQNFVTKAKNIIESHSSEFERWRVLTKEIQLYSSYLKGDLDEVRKGILFFQESKELVTEFRAVNMWLKISMPSNIDAEYWNERLQFLLRLCELSFPFIAPSRDAIGIEKNRENFEEIFLVNTVEDRPNKRKISSNNPLANLIDDNLAEINEYWRVYDTNVVYRGIARLLGPYIYDLISQASRYGTNISDIASEICEYEKKCLNKSCRKHHVNPSPSILQKRLGLACLQYTVMRQLSALSFRGLLNKGQDKILGPQRFWAEKLIKIHFRYQSPHTSCPEITYMAIQELPDSTYDGLIDLTYKCWLNWDFHVEDFANMLKFILVSIQLQNIRGVENFDWKVSKIWFPYRNNCPNGFICNDRSKICESVGKQLSTFLLSIKSNQKLPAISQAKSFIFYAVNNLEKVNIFANDSHDPHDSLGDLTSIMELTLSLIFSAHPAYFDFLLPKGYLINYFYSFDATPLLPEQHYNEKGRYFGGLKNIFHQTKTLINKLIYKKPFYPEIILRLLRLLVLIGLNESKLNFMIINYFKSLSDQLLSMKFKKYLNESRNYKLAEILNNDLKKNGCDSLLILHYNWGGKSKFAEWEKFGISRISYSSVDEFRSSLQKVMALEITRNKPETPAVEINSWIRQIYESPRAQEAARRIQTWFRKTKDREKYYKSHRDPIEHETYNNMIRFCQDMEKEKGKVAVYKYNICLRVHTVDMIVELIQIRDKMDKIKNKLSKAIEKFSDSGDDKAEECFDLKEELRCDHYENVKIALSTLSISENSKKHREADVRWLERELEQARDTIDNVSDWIDRCKNIIKF
ncbi:8533_t:CDS:10 [Acaulospora morrowiae]|uniref:8533_t:CDS:1 n=1 Tax=Acaulospora morrowiae TaxID=94023 RepID=A0A9N8V250_9GLOM|nr:8533_t:CDS:10 [Acaulospora morrowiae]